MKENNSRYTGNKKIIFQILNKKGHLDYGSKDYYQPNKKKEKIF